MKSLLINYSNYLYKNSQLLNQKTALKVGMFDQAISYSPKNIDREFYKKNREILDQKKGNGYWLWKPYLIKQALQQIKNGDLLFYSDSGCYFIKPVIPVFKLLQEMDQDILPFELHLIEKAYTKRDAFILMDCDSPKYTDSKQRIGGYHLWRKSEFTMNFVDEWLHYAQDERVITDIENQCDLENYPEFIAHRNDQSIFSVLTKKYDLVAHRDPSQYGNTERAIYPDSNYEQLIELTRRKNFHLLRKIKGKIASGYKKLYPQTM
mgnify:CR=1 FL=1